VERVDEQAFGAWMLDADAPRLATWVVPADVHVAAGLHAHIGVRPAGGQ
jgi:hypothetical protein